MLFGVVPIAAPNHDDSAKAKGPYSEHLRSFATLNRNLFQDINEEDITSYSRFVLSECNGGQLGADSLATVSGSQWMQTLVPTYAVLFKCHYWDSFIERQLSHLMQRVGAGDVFVVVDETNEPVSGIRHPEHRILRVSRAAAEAIGLFHTGKTPIFWYNNDFPLHLFTRRFPAYQYFLVLEYDVVVTLDLDRLIARLHDMRVDFVA